MPDKTKWFVLWEGKPVSEPLETENDTFKWIMDHQSMSYDWAIKYEGYSIRELPVASEGDSNAEDLS